MSNHPRTRPWSPAKADGTFPYRKGGTLYNLERCIGCGICVPVCPNDALRLEARADWVEPSQTYGDMVMDMMAKRLRAGLNLPIKKLPGHKYAAKMANDILASDID